MGLAMRTESQLVELLVRYLESSGFTVKTELPNMGQSVDVVAHKNDHLWFIEAKRKDLGRAIAQCKAHELVADYVCIALVSSTILDSTREELRRLGYGLLLYKVLDCAWHWEVEPQLNGSIWHPQRSVFERHWAGDANAD